MKSKADKQVTNPKQVSKAANEKKQQQPAKEKSIVNKFFSEQFTKTFKQYSEDVAIANTSGAAIGSSTGGEKTTYTTATDPVGGKPTGKSKKLNMFRRKPNA